MRSNFEARDWRVPKSANPDYYARFVDQLSPEALLQLAQYQPCRDAGGVKDATFELMVPAILMESGGSVSGPEELRRRFHQLFGVEIELGEVLHWLEQLERDGSVRRDGAISVSDRTRESLESRRIEFEALTGAAFEEWCTSLLRLDPHIADADMEVLWEDLNQLIGVMVSYHGAEAALVLYPEEPRSEVLRSTLNSRLNVLPERDKRLDEVRREALEQFFSAPTESQRRYLANRLDHGFFATVGTLRPSAAGVMREELAGHRLYLDTNFLIPALGVAGKRVGTPARRLLELTQRLGVEVAVTTRTLDEYQHSLRNSRAEISRNLPRRRFAGVLRTQAQRNGGISITEGYLESYELKGSAVDDWFRRAGLVEPKLEELGIALVDDEVTVVERQSRRIDDYIKLLDREASRWRKQRDELPMEHDVIHRLLIEKLREGQPRDFRSAKHWFLTEDKLLPHFGLLAIPGEGRPRVPFCMSGSAWAQIARCFTPRTHDYDQMVTDLLASPYISFGRSLSFSEVQQVVNRVSTILEDASPAVVAAFVGDEVLQAVTGAREQSEKDEVIVEAYEHKKDEMEENISTLSARVEQMQAALAAKEAEAEDAQRLKERLDATEQLLAEEQEERSRDRSLSEEEIRDLKQQRTEERAARESERLKREEAERVRRRHRKRVVGIALSLLAEAGLVALAVLGVIAPGLLLIVGGLIVALVLAPIAESPRWAARVGYLLAVLGVLVSAAGLM